MRWNVLPWSEEMWHCYSKRDCRWRSTHEYGWQRIVWDGSHGSTAATESIMLPACLLCSLIQLYKKQLVRKASWKQNNCSAWLITRKTVHQTNNATPRRHDITKWVISVDYLKQLNQSLDWFKSSWISSKACSPADMWWSDSCSSYGGSYREWFKSRT